MVLKKQTNKIIVLKWAVQASTPNTMTEVPLRKAPNPQLLPGRRSINDWPLLRVCVHGVCVFTAVCVHFEWDKCRARIPSMGHHTWLYVPSLSLFFNKILLTAPIWPAAALIKMSP